MYSLQRSNCSNAGHKNEQQRLWLRHVCHESGSAAAEYPTEQLERMWEYKEHVMEQVDKCTFLAAMTTLLQQFRCIAIQITQ